ncbi:hypothetical protein ABIC50_004711 [Burkholderia sp. 567]
MITEFVPNSIMEILSCPDAGRTRRIIPRKEQLLCPALDKCLSLLINVCHTQLDLVVQRFEVFDNARPIYCDPTGLNVLRHQTIIRYEHGGVTAREVSRQLNKSLTDDRVAKALLTFSTLKRRLAETGAAHHIRPIHAVNRAWHHVDPQ